jgi:hypothetical protein
MTTTKLQGKALKESLVEKHFLHLCSLLFNK